MQVIERLLDDQCHLVLQHRRIHLVNLCLLHLLYHNSSNVVNAVACVTKPFAFTRIPANVPTFEFTAANVVTFEPAGTRNITSKRW